MGPHLPGSKFRQDVQFVVHLGDVVVCTGVFSCVFRVLRSCIFVVSWLVRFVIGRSVDGSCG